MFSAITFVALIAYASAQSISTQCSTALTSIVANSDAAACLSTPSLIPVLSSSSGSLIGPIDNWLSKLCAAPACSNATLAAIVQNVTTGCATDLSSLGFTSDQPTQITSLVEQYYPTLRQVVCLKDGNTNCITQTLTNIQNVLGPLNMSSVASYTTGTGLSNFTANITCTDCIKAIYNEVNKTIPSSFTVAAPALQSQCGASFIDGATPSGIVESATTATAVPSTSNSAALGGVSLLSHGVFMGLSLSGLVIISTLFTLLA